MPLLLLLALSQNPAQAAPPSFRPGLASPKKPHAPPGDGRDDSRHLAPRPELPPFLERLESEPVFEAISSHSEGVVKSELVKFLIDRRSEPEKIYFLNGNFHAPDVPEAVRYHFNFAESHLGYRGGPDRFNSSCYFAPSLAEKKFIAGSLQRYRLIGGEEFFGIQFYPQDRIAEQGVLHAARMVSAAVRIPGARLAFVPYGIQQTAGSVQGALARLGISLRPLDEIYAKVPYIPMNQGEAWGYLRADRPAEDLEAADIPLFTELPLDLSVVAAVITTVVQDAGSHVNLKSKERGTPNMVLRDPAAVHALLAAWKDKPIHLSVDSSGYRIEASTPAEVERHLRKLPSGGAWQRFPRGKARPMLSYDEMAAVPTPAAMIPDAVDFGGKAAKLGFLAHRGIVGIGSPVQRSLGHRLTPLGFGVPIARYFELVAANPELQTRIRSLIAAETGEAPALSAHARREALREIQQLFHRAVIPSGMVEELKSRFGRLQREVLGAYPASPLRKLKLRSSANSEDVEGFDGAGLHDSFGASIKDGLGNPAEPCELIEAPDGVTTKRSMKPETVFCALRGVYASLWNRRAVDERTHARIHHASAGMGLAINPAYSLREKTEGIREIANGVLITRILAGGGIYGYQMSFNTEENLVTNPTPGTQSELVLATFLGQEKPEFTLTQFAKVAADKPVEKSSIVGRAVYERVVSLARSVETGYCLAVPSYYNGSCEYVTFDNAKPRSLDIEFKVYSNGEVLLKQSREFSGRY